MWRPPRNRIATHVAKPETMALLKMYTPQLKRRPKGIHIVHLPNRLYAEQDVFSHSSPNKSPTTEPKPKRPLTHEQTQSPKAHISLSPQPNSIHQANHSTESIPTSNLLLQKTTTPRDVLSYKLGSSAAQRVPDLDPEKTHETPHLPIYRRPRFFANEGQ